jgi:hypothetical protein
MLDSFCDGISDLPSCAGRVANGPRPVMCDICVDGVSSEKNLGLESESLLVANETTSGEQDPERAYRMSVGIPRRRVVTGATGVLDRSQRAQVLSETTEKVGV